MGGFSKHNVEECSIINLKQVIGKLISKSYSSKDIYMELCDPEGVHFTLNSKTGEPYKYNTIVAYINEVMQELHDSFEEVKPHYGAVVLSQYEGLLQKAIEEGKTSTATKVLDGIVRLTGIAEPTKQRIETTVETVGTDFTNLSDDQLKELMKSVDKL